MRLPFWRYPPLGWIPYPPLLAIYLAMLGVIVGLGGKLGVPSLIWHDRAATQLLAGTAAVCLCLALCFAAYLIDTNEAPDVAPKAVTFASLSRYAFWPLLVLAIVCSVDAFWRGKTRNHGLLVLVAPIVAAAGTRILGGLAAAERSLLGWLPRSLRKLVLRVSARLLAWLTRGKIKREPETDPHAAALVLDVFVVVVYVALGLGEGSVPAAVNVAFALSLVVGFWSFFRFWYRRYRLVAAIIPVLALARAGMDSRFGLRHVTFPAVGPERPRPLLEDEKALAAWKDGRLRVGEARPPLVVVATSGGALRAAVWTLNVLEHLEAAREGFVGHVRLITGASGGMVGASHFVSALAARGSTAKLTDDWFSTIIDGADGDSLTPVAHALIYPWEDRGTALERSWEKHTAERMAMPFRQLMGGEGEGWLPSLVFTPMLVEDGRRLIVSNLDLDALTVSLPTTPDRPVRSSVQLYACGGEGFDTLKLSTVARLNATFPWVTSAGRLDSTPDRRVVDAGYYDNYGVNIGAAWIRKNADWLRANTSGVLLIQIRDGRTHEADAACARGAGPLRRLVSAESTPVEAFLAARESSMLFRNEENVRLLKEQLVTNPDASPSEWFFSTVVFEFRGEAPLEWYLDEDAIANLRKPPAPQVLAEVTAWWDARGRAPGGPVFTSW
jgi:hypothetical protein